MSLPSAKWPSFVCLVFAGWMVATSLCEDYNVQQVDGSYEFGYDNPDSYHRGKANRKNVVRGEFGGRNPETGGIDVTSYTAGPRGFRPRGKNIVRKFDLNQNGPRPIGSRDDPYFDPNEDPSYNFKFNTRTYSRVEGANRRGDVSGKYTYVDDVGERHNVEYIAGKNTGFHVKTPFPDSNPRSYGPLYFKGRGKPIPRGRTSIQRGLDGSYRFVSAGPDQRRTETSDSAGNVRGSYTYLDDKGVQHSVHYIAGPKIGYRVLKNVRGPHLPTVFPFAGSPIVPSDFYDYLDKNTNTDVFQTAASGQDFDKNKPSNKPSYDDDGGDVGDLFGDSLSGGKPVNALDNEDQGQDGEDDGSYKPFVDDGDLFGGSSGRPGGGLNRPGNRPSNIKPSGNKPLNLDDDDDDDDDSFVDDSDLFGGSSTTSGSGGPSTTGSTSIDSTGSSSTGSSRPGGSFGRPGQGGSGRPGEFGGAGRPGQGGSGRPGQLGGSGRPSQGGSGRPSQGGSGRPGEFGGAGRPGQAGSGRPGQAGSGRPGQAGSGRPGQFGGSRPGSQTSFEDDEDSSDLFGGVSSTTSKPPLLSIGFEGTEETNKHTVVTNLGDKIFTVPPGVSVHAHVQSIDLFPYESKVPSPSEQLRVEVEQKVIEDSTAPPKLDATTTEESTTTTLK